MITRRHMMAAAAASLSGCGYHVAGRADLLPDTVRNIAVPPFANGSVRYKLTDQLAQSITRELISRTRYHVVHDEQDADAVLRGQVVNFMSFPTTFDTTTGRAAGVQVIVYLNLTLQERSSGKVLYQNPGMEVRERYEISVDPVAYFEESDTALTRLSGSVAKSVVSAILENF